jgi:hypothetical protein
VIVEERVRFEEAESRELERALERWTFALGTDGDKLVAGRWWRRVSQRSALQGDDQGREGTDAFSKDDVDKLYGVMSQLASWLDNTARLEGDASLAEDFRNARDQVTDAMRIAYAAREQLAGAPRLVEVRPAES